MIDLERVKIVSLGIHSTHKEHFSSRKIQDVLCRDNKSKSISSYSTGCTIMSSNITEQLYLSGQILINLQGPL